jgi:hypothetical protein
MSWRARSSGDKFLHSGAILKRNTSRLGKRRRVAALQMCQLRHRGAMLEDGMIRALNHHWNR